MTGRDTSEMPRQVTEEERHHPVRNLGHIPDYRGGIPHPILELRRRAGSGNPTLHRRGRRVADTSANPSPNPAHTAPSNGGSRNTPGCGPMPQGVRPQRGTRFPMHSHLSYVQMRHPRQGRQGVPPATNTPEQTDRHCPCDAQTTSGRLREAPRTLDTVRCDGWPQPALMWSWVQTAVTWGYGPTVWAFVPGCPPPKYCRQQTAGVRTGQTHGSPGSTST